MTALEQYIAGWRLQDTATILSALTPNCVIIESFGSVYCGHEKVSQWIKDAMNDAIEFCDYMRVLVGNNKEKAL
ncbi:hypothetical protein ACFQZI_06075 [Mucilaginibacter lutimaris]|uniref:Uncharacterized protein n=1 Tax=Mucilaginibacter lutimaris TaxID=931629 RepID=A0ABW2ZDY6_9SPHI